MILKALWECKNMPNVAIKLITKTLKEYPSLCFNAQLIEISNNIQTKTLDSITRVTIFMITFCLISMQMNGRKRRNDPLKILE